MKLKRGPKRNPDNYISVNCEGCNISFTIYKCEYRSSKTKVFYHDRPCFVQHNDKFKGNPNKRPVYLDHYRCRTCMQYIKKTDARIHTTPKGRVYPVCSNKNCGNYPLQTKPRNKKRFMKRLEEDQQEQNKKQITIPVLQSLQ